MSRLGIYGRVRERHGCRTGEFEPAKNGRLTHPRVKVESKRLAAERKQLSNAGKASAARRYNKAVPEPSKPKAAVDDSEDAAFQGMPPRSRDDEATAARPL